MPAGSVENLGEKFSLIQDDLEKVENGLKDFQGGVERHFKLQEKWRKQATKNLRDLREMQKVHRSQSKASVDVVKEYERTFKIFVKYPKKMLSDSVHTAIKARSDEMKMLRAAVDKVLAQRDPSQRLLCKVKSKMEGFTEECVAFESKMSNLEEQYVDFLEREDTTEESKDFRTAEDVQPIADEDTHHVVMSELRKVKENLNRLSSYFHELGSLAEQLEDQKKRIKELQEDCDEWMNLISGYQKENLELKEKLQRITIEASGESLQRKRSSPMNTYLRGRHLKDEIDGVKQSVDHLGQTIDSEYDLDLPKPSSEEKEGKNGRRDAPVFGNEENFRKFHASPGCNLKQDKHVDDDPGMPRGTVSDSDSPKETLECFEDSFHEKVFARGIFTRLYQYHVIPQEVKTNIERSTSDSEASELLFGHLKAQADYCSLTTMIAIMSETRSQGYCQTSNFGEDLKASLESKNKLCACALHSKK